MTKITIGIYKSFKNSGKRGHRDKTKKEWCHYFVSDDYTNEFTFGTEWVSKIKAMILKRHVYKVRKAICFECGLYFTAFLKKESDTPVCPECG